MNFLRILFDSAFGSDVGSVPLAALVTFAMLLLRWTVALWPHSGAGHPPLYGDFEAQRHWMEVTTALPIGEWYRHTSRNDLQYWGLDYPPLTAYVSWAFGSVARVLVPHAVAPMSSRGAEDPATRLFMRGAVLVSDALVLIPAVWLFVATRAALHRGWRRLSASEMASEAAVLLLMPGILLIDHGHHQYNGVVIGLVVLAIVAIMQRQWLAAAAVFTLAVNFKITALYFALPFAVVLLVKIVAGARHHGVCATFLATLSLVAVAAVVCGILWAPFCVMSSHEVEGCLEYSARRDDVPWLTTPVGAAASASCSCFGGIAAVARRIVPLDRGLFEDKVANLWCATEPLTRIGRALRRAHANDGDNLRGRVATVSATLTFALLAPSLLALYLQAKAVWRRFANAVKQAGGDASAAPKEAAKAIHATAVVPTSPVAVRGSSELRRRARGPVDHLDVGRKFDSAAQTSRRRRNSSVSVVAPPLSVAHRRIRRSPRRTEDVSATTLRSNVKTAPWSPSRSSSDELVLVTQSKTQPWLLYEHLCISLSISALAFFLASFQVHEKAVMLPLLPLSLLAHRLPVTATAAQLVGVWTMWPLLAKDRLLVPAAIVCACYAVVAWPDEIEMQRGDAAAYARAWQAWMPAWLQAHSEEEAASSAATVLRRCVWLGGWVLAACSLAAYAVPPPDVLPDLHAYVTAVVGAALLSVLLVLLTTVQGSQVSTVK